jgi:predicted PurR-regulated permease PerM
MKAFPHGAHSFQPLSGKTMLGIDMRVAKIVWTIVLMAVALLFVYAIRQTLLVLTFAIFFSYLIYPLIALAEKHSQSRIPRAALIGVVFALVFLVISAAVSVLGSQIADEASKLSQQLPSLLNGKNIYDSIPLPEFLEPLRVRMVGFVAAQLESNSGQAIPVAQKLGLGVWHAASNLIYLVLIPVLSFLLLKEAPKLQVRLLSKLQKSNSLHWTRIIKNLDMLMVGYVRALLILSLATFAIYSTAFSIMGMSYALLFGVLAGLLEVIPFIGPLVAAVGILAISAFSGYSHLLWLVLFIFGYRLFQDYVLNPYLMNAGIEVPPLLVILVLLAGEQIGGVAGIFLAVPAVAALRIIADEVVNGVVE